MSQPNDANVQKSIKAERLDKHILSELSADDYPQPRLSLYLPTHRHHPENQQDPIRFRSLVKSLELLLRENHSASEVSAILAPFAALEQNMDFWNHTLDGLVVFAAPDWFKVIVLPRSVQELTVVADSFHTKPLRRMLQTAERYQVLGLSRHEMKLFEGDRDAIEVLDLAEGIPSTITDALGDELTEAHQTVASYGGVGGSSGVMHHGHNGKCDEVDSDTVRFFSAADRSVLVNYSRATELPPILTAVTERQHLFHAVSYNPSLLAEGIKMHPDSISLIELRVCAWSIFEPIYQARLAELGNDFATAKLKDLGLDDLALIGETVTAGAAATCRY